VTDQSSILRFIEDNWRLGRLGSGSFDALANPLNGMFDFGHPAVREPRVLILDPETGEPVASHAGSDGNAAKHRPQLSSATSR
jgi:phospholipase C